MTCRCSEAAALEATAADGDLPSWLDLYRQLARIEQDLVVVMAAVVRTGMSDGPQQLVKGGAP